MTPSELLSVATDILRLGGHAQNDFGRPHSPATPHCAQGAIAEVVVARHQHHKLCDRLNFPQYGFCWTREWEENATLIQEAEYFLLATAPVGVPRRAVTIEAINDHPAMTPARAVEWFTQATRLAKEAGR